MNKKIVIILILLFFFFVGCEEKYTDDVWTVTFQNYDGTFLGYSKVKDGETVFYNGINPKKDSTEKFEYEFIGWDKETTKIRNDDVFTAQFKENLREFKVVFQNYDGTKLDDQTTLYGGSVEYHGITPFHADDNVGKYTFSGWSSSLDNITEDQTLTAVFDIEKNTFEWTFYDYDGITILAKVNCEYGEKPIYPNENPVRESTDQYDFAFAGWTNECESIKSNGSSNATYTKTIKSYIIEFKNYDGTTLQKSEYSYGTKPEYQGKTPVKKSTVTTDYVFAGWNKIISKVSGAAQYTAVFTETPRKYNVKFTNYDGTLLSSIDVEYGKSAEYSGSTPTKPSDGKSNYTFEKWDVDYSIVTKDITVKAIYTESDNIDYLGFSLSLDQQSYSVYLKSTYSATYSDFYIPLEYDGKPVTEIASLSNQYVKHIHLTDKITSIKDSAFINCYALLDIELSKNINSIGINAFSGCKALQTININASIDTISYGMFNNCNSLNTVTIGSTVKTIASHAFAGCSSLKRLTIPSSVNRIVSYAFTQSALEEIEIPNSVTTIESNAFANCYRLQKVIFNANVEVFPNELFTSCTSLNEVVIGENVKSIGANAFYNCGALKSITIPSNVTTIGSNAFAYSGITTLTIPETVTTIYTYAFSKCTYLTTVNFNANVETIPQYCFDSCTSLNALNIGSHVKTIAGYAFYQCSNLHELNIPANIENIGSFAFAYSGIINISIPSTVTTMQNQAFANAKKLASVIFNANVEYISVECFDGCTNLQYIEINSDVKYIYTNAFNGCSILRTIKLPDTLENISSYAFNNCKVLTKIILGPNIKTIYQYAFINDTLLNIYIKKENNENISISQYCKEDSSNIYYYSETEQSGYWHYVNNEPVLW